MKRIGELELSIYLKSLRGDQIIQTSGLLHYLEDEDYVNLTEINTCLISEEQTLEVPGDCVKFKFLIPFCLKALEDTKNQLQALLESVNLWYPHVSTLCTIKTKECEAYELNLAF